MQGEILKECNSKRLVRSPSNRTPLDYVSGAKTSLQICLEFEQISCLIKKNRQRYEGRVRENKGVKSLEMDHKLMIFTLQRML